MEKPLFGFSQLASFFLIFFGMISFGLCIAAEIKKSKIKDLRLDGNLCSLPESHSFGLGIASLVCFFAAQIIGCFIILTRKNQNSCLEDVGSSGWNWNARKPTIFLSLSWMSFGIAVILLGTTSSISKGQDYGKGWIDGECYIVKDGAYGGSAIFVLISVTCTLVSSILTTTTKKKSPAAEQDQKIHAQLEVV